MGVSFNMTEKRDRLISIYDHMGNIPRFENHLGFYGILLEACSYMVNLGPSSTMLPEKDEKDRKVRIELYRSSPFCRIYDLPINQPVHILLTI